MKEHDLQVLMMNAFRMAYRRYEKNLFAVPNGSFRHVSTAMKLKKEGVLAGVSDLIFCFNGNVYFIEVKTPTVYKIGKRGGKIIAKKGGTQEPSQIEFENMIIKEGLKYFIVDSVFDFMKLIKTLINK